MKKLVVTKKGDTLRSQTGRFVMIPAWLLSRCQDAAAIHLYAVLKSFADREGNAYPSTSTLATAMGVSRRTLDRSAAKLKAAGGLQTTLRHRSDGSVAGIDYLLIQVDPASVSHLAKSVQKAPAVQMDKSGQKDTAVHMDTVGQKAAPDHMDKSVQMDEPAIWTPAPTLLDKSVQAIKGRTRSTDLETYKDSSAAPTGQAAEPDKTPTLIAAYHDAFLTRFAVAPAIHGAKDGKLLKTLAASHGDTRVRDLLEWFFQIRDPFIQNSGYTVGVFFAVFNKLLLTYRPVEASTGDDPRAVMLREMRERSDARQVALEAEARTALVALAPAVRDALKARIVASFTQDYPGLAPSLNRDAYERSVKQAMIAFVVAECRTVEHNQTVWRTATDVLQQFAASLPTRATA